MALVICPMPGNFQQVTAVLNQQIERTDDIGDVLYIGLFETQAVKRFQQIIGRTQSLIGGIEEIAVARFGVNDQHGRVAIAGGECTVSGV